MNMIINSLSLSSSSLKAYLHRRGLHPTGKCECGEKETTEHYFLHCDQFQNQRIDLQAACRSVNLDFTAEALLKPDGPKRTPSKMKTIDEAITVFWKKTRHPDEVSVYPRRLQQSGITKDHQKGGEKKRTPV